jgi:hypothetical protein
MFICFERVLRNMQKILVLNIEDLYMWGWIWVISKCEIFQDGSLIAPPWMTWLSNVIFQYGRSQDFGFNENLI